MAKHFLSAGCDRRKAVNKPVVLRPHMKMSNVLPVSETTTRRACSNVCHTHQTVRINGQRSWQKYTMSCLSIEDVGTLLHRSQWCTALCTDTIVLALWKSAVRLVKRLCFATQASMSTLAAKTVRNGNVILGRSPAHAVIRKWSMHGLCMNHEVNNNGCPAVGLSKM